MNRALGWCVESFDVSRPGRLCRARERWIEGWEDIVGDPVVSRFVATGAMFTDDSAADARRGLEHAGITVTQVVDGLFPGATLLAFTEDGHPEDIPDGAEGIEAYEGYRAGGAIPLGLVRWHRRVKGPREISGLLGDEDEDRVRGFAVLRGGEDDDTLMETIWPVVGLSSLDSPPARYQPAALPELVDKLVALILMHRDKHGVALGVYTRQPLDVAGLMAQLAAEAEALVVPFAIAPMLARWDRALADLRVGWEAQNGTPFPVAQAPPEQRFVARRRRRGRRDEEEGPDAVPGEDELLEPEVAEEEPMEAGTETIELDDALFEEG